MRKALAFLAALCAVAGITLPAHAGEIPAASIDTIWNPALSHPWDSSRDSYDVRIIHNATSTVEELIYKPGCDSLGYCVQVKVWADDAAWNDCCGDREDVMGVLAEFITWDSWTHAWATPKYRHVAVDNWTATGGNKWWEAYCGTWGTPNCSGGDEWSDQNANAQHWKRIQFTGGAYGPRWQGEAWWGITTPDGHYWTGWFRTDSLRVVS